MTTEKLKSYKDLEIYQISFDLAVKIYFKSLELPNHDKFEHNPHNHHNPHNLFYISSLIIWHIKIPYIYLIKILNPGVKHAIMPGEEIYSYTEDKSYPGKLLLILENEPN